MLYVRPRQSLVDTGLPAKLEHAGRFGRPLGDSVGYLRQRLCLRDADRNGHAGPLLYGLPDSPAVIRQIVAEARKIQKRLIDRIHLDLGRKIAKCLHYPT